VVANKEFGGDADRLEGGRTVQEGLNRVRAAVETKDKHLTHAFRSLDENHDGARTLAAPLAVPCVLRQCLCVTQVCCRMTSCGTAWTAWALC